jgi:hypothetical protein
MDAAPDPFRDDDPHDDEIPALAGFTLAGALDPERTNRFRHHARDQVSTSGLIDRVHRMVVPCTGSRTRVHPRAVREGGAACRDVRGGVSRGDGRHEHRLRNRNE